MEIFKPIQNETICYHNSPFRNGQVQHVHLWSGMFHPYLLLHLLTLKVVLKYISVFTSFHLLMLSRHRLLRMNP